MESSSLFVPSAVVPEVPSDSIFLVGAQEYRVPLGPITRFELLWSWEKTPRSRFPKLLPTTYLPLSRFNDFLQGEGAFGSPPADPNPKQFNCSINHMQTAGKQARDAKRKKTARVHKARLKHDEYPYKRTFHCRCGFQTSSRRSYYTSASTCPPSAGVIQRPNTKGKHNKSAAFCGCKASFKVGVPVSSSLGEAAPVIPITYVNMEHQNHCVSTCTPECKIPEHCITTTDGTRLGFHRPQTSDALKEFLRFQYRNNSNVKPKDVRRAWRERRLAEGAMVLDPVTGEVSKEVFASTHPQHATTHSPACNLHL